MSIAARSLSAIGKLAVIGVLLGAFGVGMAGVIYVSLSGSEIKVPEIVGKDFVQSEKELAALGLKLKKRADRPSTEPINTVIEQLPKAGETVKTGQLILVVVSKAGLTGEEVPPPSLKKDIDADDSEKIEEMISDKPKKARSNSNSAKKKADTSRDTMDGDTSSDSTNSNKAGDAKSDAADKKEPGSGTVDKQGDSKPPPPKTQNLPTVAKPPAARPSGTDSKPRQP